MQIFLATIENFVPDDILYGVTSVSVKSVILVE
jgi:hypothetical protein